MQYVVVITDKTGILVKEKLSLNTRKYSLYFLIGFLYLFFTTSKFHTLSSSKLVNYFNRKNCLEILEKKNCFINSPSAINFQ